MMVPFRYLALIVLVHSQSSLECHGFYLAPNLKSHCSLPATKDSWSIADDWDSLSSETQENSSFDSSKLFNQHPADYAAQQMEAQMAMEGRNNVPTSEDVWLTDVLDEIQHSDNVDGMYDTSFEEEDFVSTASSDEVMDQEIAMLVRCNEHPGDLLIHEGRAIAELTQEEKNDPFQLVKFSEESKFQPTQFLKDAISIMFLRHCTPHELDGVPCLDRKGIAKWMTKSLQEPRPVSAHDSRVLETLSQYSRYGSGRLEQEDFERLYLAAIVGDASNVGSAGTSTKRHLQFRQANIDAVWRDIRNHGILSPVEQERQQLVEELKAQQKPSNIQTTVADGEVVDECEILDYNWEAPRSKDTKWEKSQAFGAFSSHGGVEMAKDNKTPLRIKDGKFVFIDEDSCIGCMQCVNVAPASFMMLETGRARTFHQRSSPEVDQAVASCPVDCMHGVTFRELKEFETARDIGDGRDDHNYLGRKQVPLHVVESDHNRRSSWYHTLKHKCLVSSECPQKGCYDCPKFSNPGDNPYFKKNSKAMQHTRAQHFMENGDADAWRKTADL